MRAWHHHPSLQKIIKILQTYRVEAYLVGGAVRDLLLEREALVDLDFAVPGDGLTVARQVANALKGAFYPLDAERGTGRVVYKRQTSTGPQKTHLDFATFRGPTLLADLRDRDFTINAMALSLVDPPELIDPLQGQKDLEQGQIRAVSETALANDPVRILRAVRQVAEFDFVIDPHTVQLIRHTAPDLIKISPERQRDELIKLLNTPRPGQAIQHLQSFDILPHILPEIETMVGVEQSKPHYLNVFEHTTTALTAWAAMQQQPFSDLDASLRDKTKNYLGGALTGDLTLHTLMPVALLFHDTGKPLTQAEVSQGQERDDYTKITFLNHEKMSAKLTRQALQRLRFSRQAISFVETIVRHHMRPLSLTSASRVSRRALYRFFRDTAGAGYQAGPAVALHALADHQATYPPNTGQTETEALLAVVNRLIVAYFDQQAQVVDPPTLLTGRDLIKMFNLTEGRLIGVLLERLKEAQAAGQVNDKSGALTFVQADPDFMAYQANND